MSNLTNFNFNGNSVEVIELNGQVLFNARHIGECLEIADISTSTKDFSDKHLVKLTNSDTHSMRFRNLNNKGENFLTEAGVYKLIFKSRKPEAEKFQDWVTSEVLPSIRKTGSYTKALSTLDILEYQIKLLREQEAKIIQIEQKQDYQDNKLLEIESRLISSHSHYYTISGYANLIGLRNLNIREAGFYGKKATKISKDFGYKINKVKDERFGHVNTYHIDVLERLEMAKATDVALVD